MHKVELEVGGSVEVEILLATYNGARFLAEQIDSLLQQDYRAIRILVRDDGSKDATPEILRQYADMYSDTITVLSDNVLTRGPKNNFALLMEASTASFIMFCDQDDVWDLDKVSASMEVMRSLVLQHGEAVPLLVYSDLRVVDENLSVQHRSFWKRHSMNPKAVRRLPKLLCCNVVSGCTMLFNRSLLSLSLPIPREAFMHDWWIALIVSLFGHSSYLKRSTVQYRQHNSNVVGSNSEPPHQPLRQTLHEHSGRRLIWNPSYQIAEALWRAHCAIMSKSQQDVINAFIRCNDSVNRIERVATMLRYRFFFPEIRKTLAIFWYLWDKDHTTRE